MPPDMTDDEVDEEEEEEGDRESGPFCRHWGDPSYCDEKCIRCGHTCPRHGEDGCDDCDCPGYEDDEIEPR